MSKINPSRILGFMFRLTTKEKAEVVVNCDHLKRLKYSPNLPYAFTEHGAVMLASVLNSSIAVKASLQVVRTYVRLRRMLADNEVLARRLKLLETKYDAQFKVVFDAIREMMVPPGEPKQRIGFIRKSAKR